MELQEFQSVVQETVQGLEPRFRAMLENVIIAIEPFPATRRGQSRTRTSHGLLGLYEGVPVTEWGIDYSGKLPDKITLYQQNIEEYAAEPEDIPRVIRETLLHEIAHHFGLDHDRIDVMEERWRAGYKDGRDTSQSI